MSYIITGLDVGTSEVKGIVAERKKNNELSVLSVFKRPSQGFKRGVLIDIEEAVLMFREIILDIEKVSKHASENIFVNINSEQIKSRISRGTVAVSRGDQTIQQDDIDRVTQASRAVKLVNNNTVIHNIIREYLVDDVGDIADPLGMNGSRLEAITIIIEVFLPHFATLIKAIEMAGGEIGGVICNPLATSRAVLSKRQKELGSLVIDYGAGTTTIAVFEENKALHVKSFPIGSSYITTDIALGLKTSIDVAEKMKLSEGNTFSNDVSRKESIFLEEYDPSLKGEISKRFLSEIIEARMVEILSLVQGELKLINKQARLPGGVVIAGGGAHIRGLEELVRQELKMAVQMGYPDCSKLEVLNPAHRELLEDPNFACAVGLVLSGLDETTKKAGMSMSPETLKNFFKNLMP